MDRPMTRLPGSSLSSASSAVMNSGWRIAGIASYGSRVTISRSRSTVSGGSASEAAGGGGAGADVAVAAGGADVGAAVEVAVAGTPVAAGAVAAEDGRRSRRGRGLLCRGRRGRSGRSRVAGSTGSVRRARAGGGCEYEAGDYGCRQANVEHGGRCSSVGSFG